LEEGEQLGIAKSASGSVSRRVGSIKTPVPVTGNGLFKDPVNHHYRNESHEIQVEIASGYAVIQELFAFTPTAGSFG